MMKRRYWIIAVILVLSIVGIPDMLGRVYAQTSSFGGRLKVLRSGKEIKFKVKFIGEEIREGKHIYTYEDKIAGMQTIDTVDIIEIKFGDGKKFARAQRKWERGELEDCIADLLAIKDVNEPWWQPGYVLYYLALAHSELGKTAPAMMYYEELLKRAPGSRFVGEVLYLTAAYKVRKGNTAAASAALAELVASKQIYGSKWSAMGSLLQADIVFLAGKYADALPKYKALVKSLEASYKGDADRTSVYAAAKSKVASCMLKAGNKAEAQAVFEELVKGESNAEKAGGYLGIGQLKLDKQEYRAAILDFLRVIYLYRNQKGLHVDAAYFASFCYAKLYKKEKLESDKVKCKKLYSKVWFAGQRKRADVVRKMLK